MNACFAPDWAPIQTLFEKNFEVEMHETWFEVHGFFQKPVMNQQKNTCAQLTLLKQRKFEFWPVKLNSG